MLVLLVGRATNPDFVISKRHFKLAVIAEMIHTASLIHGAHDTRRCTRHLATCT